jgi:hypothetical protein
VTFAILDDAQSTAFLKIEVPFSIYVSNELVGAFPTRTQGFSFPWLFHLHHRLTCNQPFKQMLTSSGSIDFLLLFLSLSHIVQDVIVNASNEFHLLQKLSCSIFYASPIVSFSG